MNETPKITRLGLLSDVHATVAPLLNALEIFQKEGVETILCAGDIAGYGSQLDETIGMLAGSRCRSVLGNHDLWQLEDNADAFLQTSGYLRDLPVALTLCEQGKTIFMVHASPPASVMNGIRLLDRTGHLIEEQKRFWQETLTGLEADVLVVGHTHQVFAEQIGDLLVINPGSTLFNHTCAILTLPEMNVDFFPLCGKEPILSWNFSMFKDSLDLLKE
jgi:putative phosphoesterase